MATRQERWDDSNLCLKVAPRVSRNSHSTTSPVLRIRILTSPISITGTGILASTWMTGFSHWYLASRVHCRSSNYMAQAASFLSVITFICHISSMQRQCHLRNMKEAQNVPWLSSTHFPYRHQFPYYGAWRFGGMSSNFLTMNIAIMYGI